MMTIQDNAISAGLRAARMVCGRDIVYHRGDDVLEFKAIKGKHTERAVDGTVVVAETELTDWIFPVVELRFLDPAEPGKQDWCEVDGHRYDVAEVAGTGWWEHMTPDKSWIRLHTVIT